MYYESITGKVRVICKLIVTLAAIAAVIGFILLIDDNKTNNTIGGILLGGGIASALTTIIPFVLCEITDILHLATSEIKKVEIAEDKIYQELIKLTSKDKSETEE